MATCDTRDTGERHASTDERDSARDSAREDVSEGQDDGQSDGQGARQSVRWIEARGTEGGGGTERVQATGKQGKRRESHWKGLASKLA